MDTLIGLGIVAVIVLVITLVWRGSAKMYREFREKYQRQAPQRYELIRILAESNTGWQHIARVLNEGGFNDEKGQAFTSETVQQEHATMVLKQFQNR